MLEQSLLVEPMLGQLFYVAGGLEKGPVEDTALAA